MPDSIKGPIPLPSPTDKVTTINIDTGKTETFVPFVPTLRFRILRPMHAGWTPDRPHLMEGDVLQQAWSGGLGTVRWQPLEVKIIQPGEDPHV